MIQQLLIRAKNLNYIDYSLAVDYWMILSHSVFSLLALATTHRQVRAVNLKVLLHVHLMKALLNVHLMFDLPGVIAPSTSLPNVITETEHQEPECFSSSSDDVQLHQLIQYFIDPHLQIQSRIIQFISAHKIANNIEFGIFFV